MKGRFIPQSPRVRIILIVFLAILCIVSFFMFAVKDSVPLPTDGAQGGNSGDTLVGLIPKKIIIPKIGVSASVVPVGVDAQGNMAVPEDVQTVGWYEPGFKPGQFGSAVFAGHVNSRFGFPTIFKDLGKIKVGDTFSIISGAREELIFEVVAKNIYDFRDAPLEEIYGPQEVPTINLITCNDELWLGAEGTYKDRLVVTAVLVTAEDEN
ncbi:MAG: class F sortase [Candidatus Paceibacterota bacterium]